KCGLVLLALLAWSWTLWSAIEIWPNHLCYVNEAWGGSASGYQFVSDGNYDWGQGLKELARWQKEREVPVIDLWYFGKDPAA
ncbi:hypothetical protein, partial [Klebsiella pneumoniae]|uniref:hypothetical protein n=1 Tax=Klebsiella pneumoniae TaxID=573 RepID=UPI003463EFCC